MTTIDLIKKFEGVKLHAYQDSGGVWTVGAGHTGKDVTPGLVITQEQADSLLIKDLVVFEAGVDTLVKVPISDAQKSALVSFAYNLGLHTLAGSTLLKKLNSGDIRGAADQFELFDRVNGKAVQGLLNRRQAEKALFLSG
jgi:lysozyme